MKTPEILHSAIRQYRHNTAVFDGLVMGFDEAETILVVRQLQQEIESLETEFIFLRDQQQQCLKEIESLRSKLEHITKDKVFYKRRGDEWKHRLHEYRDMLGTLPGSVLSFDMRTRPGDPGVSISYTAAIEERYPEAAQWFEEE